MEPPSRTRKTADTLRIEAISYVYAAVLGYSFSTWDMNEIDLGSMLDWFRLLFYVGTIAVICFEFVYVREQYEKDQQYGTYDFVTDIFIVFVYSRMLNNAQELYQDGIPQSFRWWMWAGLAFMLYILWDLRRENHSAMEKAIWVVIDFTGAALCFAFFHVVPEDSSLKEGVWPIWIALASIGFYLIVITAWYKTEQIKRGIHRLFQLIHVRHS